MYEDVESVYDLEDDFYFDGISFFMDVYGVLYYMLFTDDNTINDWKIVDKPWMFNLFFGNRMRDGQIIHC